MAHRSLLHLTHLPEFDAWMEGRGYTVAATKGDHEIRRYVNPQEEGKRRTVILYLRDSTHSEKSPPQHVTLQEKDRGLGAAFFQRRANGGL